MRTKLTIKLFPWEDGSCSLEVHQGATYIASGKAASLEQAEKRCINAFGDLIGEFDVLATPAELRELVDRGELAGPAPKRGSKFAKKAEEPAED